MKGGAQSREGDEEWKGTMEGGRERMNGRKKKEGNREMKDTPYMIL